MFPHSFDNDKKLHGGVTLLKLLTGKPHDALSYAINNTQFEMYGGPKKPLTAKVGYVAPTVFLKAASKYGLRFSAHRETHGMTFKTLADDLAYVKVPVVIRTSNHWALWYQGKLYDNFAPYGVTPDKYHFKGGRTAAYWLVEKYKEGKPEPKPEPVRRRIALTDEAADVAPAKPKQSLLERRLKHAEFMAADWASKAKRAAKKEKQWAKRVKYYQSAIKKKAAPAPRRKLEIVERQVNHD